MPMNDVTVSSSLLAFSLNDDVLNTIKAAVANAPLADLQLIHGDGAQAITHLHHIRSPNILLVDISGHKQPKLTLEKIAGTCDRNVKVIVIGDIQSVDLYRQFLSMGVSEYLTLPLDTQLLSTTINGLMANVHTLASRSGTWVSVVGAKGGCGVTTLTAQIARGLAQAKHHTLAVDSNYCRGDLDIHLDTSAHYSMQDLVQEHSTIDALVIERANSQISPYLSMIKGRDNVNAMTAAQAMTLSDTLCEHHQFVVCDIAANTDSRSDINALINASEIVVVVLTPTLSGVREAKKVLNMCQLNGASRQILVLNYLAPGSHYALSVSQINNQLNTAIDIILPYAPERIIGSSELAKSLLDDKGKLAQRLNDLLHLITPTTAPKKWWSHWIARNKRVVEA